MELIGFLLPPFIDLVNRRIKDNDARFWISAAVCAAIGLAANYLGHSYHFGDQQSLMQSIASVFGLAQLSFQAYWGGSSLRGKMFNDPQNPMLN
jgi:hypothetical protein